MIFKDVNGREYESVDMNTNELVIRPVKAEPEKWSYSLRWESNDKLPPDYFIDQEFKLTEDQAQLIKQSIQNLMKYITDDWSRETYRDFWTSAVKRDADKALLAMKENTNA